MVCHWPSLREGHLLQGGFIWYHQLAAKNLHPGRWKGGDAMRAMSIVFAVLFLSCSGASGDISTCSVDGFVDDTAYLGSYVEMCAWISNRSSDESVACATLYVTPPWYGALAMCNPSYYPDQLEPGRPSWDMQGTLPGSEVSWCDANGGSGEVWPGESALIYFNVYVSETCPYGDYAIYYYIMGDGSGAPPHESSGETGRVIIQDPSPVEAASWGSIKALFR